MILDRAVAVYSIYRTAVVAAGGCRWVMQAVKMAVPRVDRDSREQLGRQSMFRLGWCLGTI